MRGTAQSRPAAMRHSAARYRRRRVGVFGGLAIVLSALLYVPATLLAPLEPTAPVAAQFETPAVTAPDLTWPTNSGTAIGAVGFDGVLAQAGTTEQHAIASITKIITTLTVLDAHPLAAGEAGPVLSFGREDEGYYHDYLRANGSVAPVSAGLSLPLRDVLHLVLLSSANNYTKSLAVWAFGSEQQFVTAANAWLATNGLTSTVIHEPTGMDPNNLSTATDLLLLAKLALADPTVADIVAKPTATVSGVGDIRNSNRLLGEVGIDGIKTGTLDAAGACLLFAADYTIGDETVTVVGVALGGENHRTQFPQVRALMESVVEGFRQVEVISPGEVFGTYRTDWGDTAQAVAGEGHSRLLWGGQDITVTAELPSLGHTQDDSIIGAATVTVDGESVSVPLVLDGKLADPGPLWRLTNPLELVGE